MTQTGVSGQLPLRPFGGTGLSVTSLCMGCAPLGDMPETLGYSVGDDQAMETLRALFESPINTLDTAAAYGDGTAERRIGEALRARGGAPEGFVLATKADRDLQSGDFSGDQMRRSVERSLRLLGLDRLQVVHLHDPEHTTFENVTAPGGALDALVRLKEEGVIGCLGVAGGPIEMEIRYVETGVFDAVVTHNRYTLLNRSAEPLLDQAHARGMAVLNAAPYGSGILAKGPDSGARYAYQEAPDGTVSLVRRIAEVCDRYDVPLAAAALQFSLRDARITSTVVGMTRPERVAQTLELAMLSTPDDLWAELDALPYSTDDPEASRW